MLLWIDAHLYFVCSFDEVKKENKILTDFHYATFKNSYGENTCYINVVLHILYNIEQFRESILKINCNYKAKSKNGIISKKYNFKFKKSIKPNYPLYDTKNSDEENKNIEENKINAKPSRYKIPRSLLNRKKSNYAKDDDKLFKNIVISNSIDNYIKKDKFYYERLMPYLINIEGIINLFMIMKDYLMIY